MIGTELIYYCRNSLRAAKNSDFGCGLPAALGRRIVQAYRSGRAGSYQATAELLRVGRATVSRLPRRHRETGDVKPFPVGGNYPRQVDLDWLREHARREPDDRLVDRIDAWEATSGRRVASSTMSKAMRMIGWTHKKGLRSPTKETVKT